MAYTNVWTTAAPLDTQAANQGAVDFRATKLDVMQRIASFGAGLLASRPTPEVTSGTANWTGVTYLATDTRQLFRWNGSSWDDISADVPAGTFTADFLATSGADVNVVAAAPPTTGQALTATDATHATWQDIVAKFLATSGASVDVHSAAPPTVGKVLTATDATHATWQTPSNTTPTVVMKTGSRNGTDYPVASASPTDIDPVNLSYTVVVPVGWVLIIACSGGLNTAGNAVPVIFLAVDGAVVNLVEMGGVATAMVFAHNYVFVGDGASHTFTLQEEKLAGGSAVLFNQTNQFTTMVFTLTPTN